MIDNECLECKRYYSGSCYGVEDRKREVINKYNSCSGFIKKKSFGKSSSSCIYNNVEQDWDFCK